VTQLVLPAGRQSIVLSMAHDANFAGHLANDKTMQHIRLSFWFPRMKEIVRQYCASCDICQERAPVKVSDRVPITPIPRNEELPFTHLIMDCIGPIIPENDSAILKPEYNYALVVVDKCTRWPIRCAQ
jgi:ferredoxin